MCDCVLRERTRTQILTDFTAKVYNFQLSNHGIYVLAVAGTQSVVSKSTERRQEMSMILFYSPNGQHLRTLKVSSSPINTLSWERSGLRIALTVENYIFFANVRPDYKWAFFSNTLVYVLFV